TSKGTRAERPSTVRLSVGSIQTRSTAADTSAGKASRDPRITGHRPAGAPLAPVARVSRTVAIARSLGAWWRVERTLSSFRLSMTDTSREDSEERKRRSAALQRPSRDRLVD